MAVSGINSQGSNVSSKQETSKVETNATNNYSEQLKAKGLSSIMIKLLDELDGSDTDGIRENVYNAAIDCMSGLTREEAAQKYGEQLTNEIGKILDLTNQKDPTGELPMYIKPEDAMKELGISAKQAGELAKLNNQDSSKGIQRGFYMLAEKIVKGEKIDDPSGMFSAKADAVRAILQNEQETKPEEI